MNETSLALSKACASSDVELVHLVLLHARSALADAEFYELLLPSPMAQSLWARHCEAREPESLKALYYHANQPIEAANLAIREAYRAASWAQRMRGLSIALQFYEHSVVTHPHCAALAKATEDQLKLLDAQRQLERDTHGMPPPQGAPPPPGGEKYRFIDQTANETVYRCFAYGQSATAERLRKELNIPEKRWWRLKLRGLAHARNWAALWELGSARRSPIGFKPFADACIEQDAFEEAARYAAKLSAAEAVPIWLRVGRVDEARKVAMPLKDRQPELITMVTDYVLAATSAANSS
jgi:hypothetical protein